MKPTRSETNFIIDAILEFIPVKIEIYFAGSRISGSARASSDLDILIKGTAPIDLTSLSQIKEKFEESNLPFKVDVLDYHRCSPQMIKNISKNMCKVYP
ncbi:MAG: nucleotidyltransferase domain-containing protein [Deltaproteobacteria bacterium]|nr:nucleotidyltransferase domain-containing protein [Deltaproteobacteria bacterium]MBI2341116.1 nucleotidyltransferase domain-containing protein [Deltaproteobacteria bacterium]